ncbi:MAG TPA: hypothetical protein VHA56_16255 [Mucilaginibacter sp.]|nr:hypothetical protein [Mucilaginibacter sp.]
MIQLELDFYSKRGGDAIVSPAELKAGLEEYIKASGLVAYKDFFIKLKNGSILTPAGISRDDYLAMAREVYESRAAKVNRQKSRAKFFAVRNRISKKTS